MRSYLSLKLKRMLFKISEPDQSVKFVKEEYYCDLNEKLTAMPNRAEVADLSITVRVRLLIL